MKPVFQLRIRRKSDVLRARQRGRQIARAAGLQTPEQAIFAAATFDVAKTVLRARGIVAFCVLSEQIAVGRLHAGFVCTYAMELPEGRRRSSLEDLAFTLEHVEQMAPFDVFEEVCLQNQEMLVLGAGLAHPSRPQLFEAA